MLDAVLLKYRNYLTVILVAVCKIYLLTVIAGAYMADKKTDIWLQNNVLVQKCVTHNYRIIFLTRTYNYR